MKKLNVLLIISVVALFLVCPSFSNAQRSNRRSRTNAERSKPKPKTAPSETPQNKAVQNEKQNAKIAPDDFSVKGLNNENLFVKFYHGDFANVGFKRDALNFSILYSAYIKSYSRQCDAHLPRNKVEMTTQECSRERIVRNGFGTVISRNCVEWKTVGTGFYADPEMYDAKLELDRLQVANSMDHMVDLLGGGNPLAKAMAMARYAKAAVDDMNEVVKTNSCTSPGLKKFQENLKLFALDKKPNQTK